jgi:4-phytase / acid phosphatase
VALALGPASTLAAESEPATALKLERVVMLMRHGIRPPTKAAVTPPGITAAPWPKWDAPYGHLTAHGAEAIRLLGRFDRESFAARGLLPGDGCPKAGTVSVWSDTDQRTIATATRCSTVCSPAAESATAVSLKARRIRCFTLT